MGSRLMVSNAHKSAGTHAPRSAGGGNGVHGMLEPMKDRHAALPGTGHRQLPGCSVSYFLTDSQLLIVSVGE